MSTLDVDAQARHEVGERWRASQEQARLLDEVRGIRSTINILIAAEKERLARIEELRKILSKEVKS